MHQGDFVTDGKGCLPDDPGNIERSFLTIPSPESARSVSSSWTSKPHLAGSQSDYESAVDLLRAFQNNLVIQSPESLPVYDAGSPESRNAILGISELEQPKAWIDTYYPLLETPGERRLEILDPDGTVSWSANLEEHPPEASGVTGVWHAWSQPGDVKSRVINASYGYDNDYERLKKEGHDVTGAIVLIQDGGSFRGLRVKEAAEAGAIGCLTFRGPDMDGPVTVKNGYQPWPEGPARNPDSITRGHVSDVSMHSGDPTTPGYPSYRDAPRVEPRSFPAIPSLPISWNNAQILMKEMGSSGGKISEREVRLVNNVHRKIGPIWNVMVVIPGHIRDEVVIAGNHRDAWIFGASDPTSGTVSLHEMSKGLGGLLRQGWKPLRTILLASWDGEEYGLFGSTEWAEDFRDWLKEHAVAYLNVDKASSGRQLRLRATPSVAPLLRQAALDLPHYNEPDSGRTLWDARRDRGPFTGPTMKEESPYAVNYPPAVHGTGIKSLATGSDYTVFLQQLGITCGDIAFTDAVGDAVYHYHSFYDSEDWMDKYGDPGFLRRVAIARYWGLVLLRMVDPFILPLDTTQYALELDDYLDRVVHVLPTLPGAPDVTQLRTAIKKVQEASKNLDLHKYQVKARLDEYINRTSREGTTNARESLQKAFGSFGSGTCRTSELAELIVDVREINKKLSNFERGFISEAGLPGREWYRHLIVAPGKWTGYGATTFPSLTEAISEDRDPVRAAQQIERLTQLLHALADNLNK
ncbi:unnamed protein product [Rhizoctonia solani]|uniref:Zn-dependent exopeptidase n=1 Tax=Rhizoctonia solani TaxID=456999 RepID=A0A8H3HSA0_9AGAM|nr:unnamed protein product [Rhizoctonia solani]